MRIKVRRAKVTDSLSAFIPESYFLFLIFAFPLLPFTFCYLYAMKHPLLITLLLLTTALSVRAQQPKNADPYANVPAGISWHEWDRMSKRWAPFTTRLDIRMKDGGQVQGQLIWMDDREMMVRRDFSLPGGFLDPEEDTRISLSDMASMKVRLGGPPFQGLFWGMVPGAVPGVVTGLILAQGWTVIPAIVFGAVTAGGGGALGNLVQKIQRKQAFTLDAGNWNDGSLRRLKRSAWFPGELPEIIPTGKSPTLTDFDHLVQLSPTLRKAFPENPFALSIHASLATHSVRKRLQNWYMSPLFGPPYAYYETRIGLEADLSRRIGKRFQTGLLVQFFPDDISSSFFTATLPEWNVWVDYNHHFRQTTFGLYGGWILQPAGPYWARRLEASIQAGMVVSDIYEHFFFQWDALDDNTRGGDTFIQQHNLKPGALMRIRTSWYLVPGLSVDAGIEGYWIKKLVFEPREVLPQTSYGPEYITGHSLNFSNMQAFVGLSAHF
jgi:hypothetical protein